MAIRIAILWTSPESVFWYEDLYQGTIAKEILSGSKLPFIQWQAAPHEGGTLWMGLTAIPFFLLFGPTYFALKLVPIAFGLTTLILAYGFLSRHFSRHAANIGACLMVFGAPAYIKLRMLAVGTHPSSGILWLPALWCFYEAMAAAPDTRRNRLFLFLTGLFSGLGLGYAYIVGIGVTALLASWLLWNPRNLFSKNFFFFLGGFLAGYSPTLFYNALHGWTGFHWMLDWLTDPSIQTMGESEDGLFFRILFVLFKAIPLSFSFDNIAGISWKIWTAPYGAMIAAAFAFACWKNKKSKKFIPFFIYPAVFTMAYALSPWYTSDLGSSYFSFRYFAPIQRILLLGAAIGISQVSTASLRRLWLGAIFILALLGQTSMIQKPEWKSASSFPGYSYWWLGAIWDAPFPDEYDHFLKLAGKVGQEYHHRLYAGYFNFLAMPKLHSEFSSSQAQELLQMAKADTSLKRLYMFKVLGRYIFYHRKLDIETFLSLAKTMTRQEQSHFYARAFKDISTLNLTSIPWGKINQLGTGKDWLTFSLGAHFYESPEWEMIRPRLDPSWEKWIYRGIGKYRGEQWHSGWMTFQDESAVPSGVPEQFLGEFMWGFGWGAANYFPYRDSASEFERFLREKSFGENLIQQALKGFDSYRQWQKGLLPHPE